MPRNDAPIEAAVNPELTASGLELVRKGPGRRRHGRAIEWHVDQGRDPAGGGGTRGRDEPFPLGSARFVDVYMSINDARQDGKIAHVNNSTGRRQLVWFDDVDDRFARDQKGGRSNSRRRDHPAA